MFVSTNVRFLEDDYVNNYKSKSRVVQEETSDTRAGTFVDVFGDEVVVSDTPQVTADEIPSIIIPRRSDRFMFLGEAFEVIQKNPSRIP